MQFKNVTAHLFVPDGIAIGDALGRTTHFGIGAHQDDLEIMAVHGILQCFQQDTKWFTGVVVTNGSGSARSGLYQGYTDDQMREVRNKEQRKAAIIGEYAAQVLLDYPSAAVKDGNDDNPTDDFEMLLKAAKPEVIYTHNLADKHTTHVGVAVKVIKAIRRLPQSERPKQIFGCEVWRDLDWMVDDDKVGFDVSGHEGVQNALVGIFDSQITGGKRYDLATMGRRRANATYHASHATDATTGLVFAMNLTPLVEDVDKDIQAYVQEYIARFQEDVQNRLGSVL